MGIITNKLNIMLVIGAFKSFRYNQVTLYQYQLWSWRLPGFFTAIPLGMWIPAHEKYYLAGVIDVLMTLTIWRVFFRARYSSSQPRLDGLSATPNPHYLH